MELTKEQIKAYLKENTKSKIKNIQITELGSGIVGTGYRITYNDNNKIKTLIIKSIFKENLGMDNPGDRAASLLQAHTNYNTMRNHIKSKDVIVLKNKKAESIGNAEEFYIAMEEASGKDMFTDLDNIDNDKSYQLFLEKTKKIAQDLVELHKNKVNNPILYKRKIRDTIGSGGSLMGVLDMHTIEDYSKYKTHWETIIKECIPYWSKSKHLTHRCCEIHGDFHPGNIWFKEKKVTYLDRAGGRFGEPADDLTAFFINPIFYSIIKHGNFQGKYKEIFDMFWNTYFKQTKDKEMRTIMAPYIAFRASVITNPMFYNDEKLGGKENAQQIRIKILSLTINILQDKEFKPEKINQYLNQNPFK
ncbi:MAG: hypothetical protein ACI83O_000840 [Patescibacteria group bacterium]|jgi:hypothetical protein